MGARTTRTMADVMVGASPGETGVTINSLRSNLTASVESVIEELTIVPIVSAAGENMTIVSASAGDVGAVLRLSLLGPNYTRLPTVDVTLNGTTPVAIPGGPYTRVNGVSRVSGDTAGNVTINSSAQVRGFLAAGQQNQRSSRYTVPAGFRFFILDLISSLLKDGGTNAVCAFAIKGKPVASANFGAFLQWGLQRDGANCEHFSQHVAGGITGPFDVLVTATPATASQDVQAYYAGLLQDLSV